MHWKHSKTYHAYKTLQADNIHTSTKQMLEGRCQWNIILINLQFQFILFVCLTHNIVLKYNKVQKIYGLVTSILSSSENLTFSKGSLNSTVKYFK